MNIDTFRSVAIEAIQANPGLTRMEWFHACCTTQEQKDTLWHTFKFQVALVLIMGGKVKAKDNKFFPSSC